MSDGFDGSGRRKGLRGRTKPRAALAWGLAVFVMLQGALLWAIETRATWNDPRYGRALGLLKAQVRAMPPGTPEVVALGSSHIYFGFDAFGAEAEVIRATRKPAVVFNFARPAGGGVQELLYFSRLRAAGIKPTLLVMEFMPLFMAGDADRQGIFADQLTFKERALVRRYGGYARNSDLPWLSWLVPQLGHRDALLVPLGDSWTSEDRYGKLVGLPDAGGWQSMGFPTAQERPRMLEASRSAYHDRMDHFEFPTPACDAFEAVLARCQQEHIGAVVLLAPESHMAGGWWSEEAKRAIPAWIERVTAEHGATFVDARRWLDDGLFFDGHHLDEAGARAFGKKMADDLIVPWLKGHGR